MHAVISRLFIKGATRFTFGAQQLADALVACITANGGTVRLRAEVCAAELGSDRITVLRGDFKTNVVRDGLQMTAVRLTSGERIEGARFISTVHPERSLSWFPPSAFSKAFTNRIKAQKHTDSVFSLFVTLQPEQFPYINSNIFYVRDYKDICMPPLWEASGPRTLMAFTAPSGRSGNFARTLKISAPISFEPFRRWEGKLPGERGSDYEAFKQQCADALFSRVATLFPRLPSAVESLFAATPLTYQFYSGSKEGSSYGFSKDCQNLNFSRLLPRTKIPNFFFSGQNLNMHGILGVPISAVITCGELIGVQLLKKMDKIG